MKVIIINPDYINATFEKTAVDLNGNEIEELKPFPRYNSIEDAKNDTNRIPHYREIEE